VIKGQTEVNFQVVPPPQRIGDFYIMDAVLSSDIFDNRSIQLINYCCLYLRAITVSDISLANGRSLDLSMVRGVPSLLSSKSKLIWINQSRPSEASWTQWRKACRIWSKSDGSLIEPLGKWLHRHSTLRGQWPAMYHRQTKQLYITSPASTTTVTGYIRGSYHTQPWTATSTPRSSLAVAIEALDNS
jgi:hypothetical protein